MTDNNIIKLLLELSEEEKLTVLAELEKRKEKQEEEMNNDQ